MHPYTNQPSFLKWSTNRFSAMSKTTKAFTLKQLGIEDNLTDRSEMERVDAITDSIENDRRRCMKFMHAEI